MTEEEEVDLTLADIEDTTKFDELYADWAVKDLIPLHPDALRTVCKLWYSRGVARGTEWFESEMDRLTEQGKQ